MFDHKIPFALLLLPSGYPFSHSGKFSSFLFLLQAKWTLDEILFLSTLRRRKARRELGNMGAIRGNPQTTLRRRGCQRNSSKQDHGHHPEWKNDDGICERIPNDSSRDRIRRRNLDQTPIGRNVKETTRRLGSRRNRQSQHNTGHH